MYINKAKVSKDNLPNQIKIKNTINLYYKKHPNFPLDTFNQVPKHCLEYIAKYDASIILDNVAIFQALYKILELIDNTFRQLKFIEQSSYPKKYFASFQSSKKDIKSEYRITKKLIVNARTKIFDKGELRANLWFYNIFNRNKNLARFFLNQFSLVDFNKVADVHKTEINTRNKVINFFEEKLIQKTTKPKIIKSLGILLHYGFKEFLEIKDTKSKELVAEMIQYIFDVNRPNDEGFNNHVYIDSTILSMPIFGATKRNPYPPLIKKEISKTYIKIFRDLKYKNVLKEKELSLAIEDVLFKSHIQYVSKLPEDFFGINPKYSHLKLL